jgi:hypothetical protein
LGRFEGGQIKMIKVWKKLNRVPDIGAAIVDTTSNTDPMWKYLSPFILPAPPAKNLENLWQFSKVYFPEHMDDDYNPNHIWYEWQQKGFADSKAHRYPMGKGRKPFYSMWNGKKLGYILARKEIYIPEYAKNVIRTNSFQKLVGLKVQCHYYKRDLYLLDYDGYDHQALGMTLQDVVNNPDKTMGHAFVLYGLLTGELEEIK